MSNTKLVLDPFSTGPDEVLIDLVDDNGRSISNIVGSVTITLKANGNLAVEVRDMEGGRIASQLVTPDQIADCNNT